MNFTDQDITNKLKHNNEEGLRLLFDQYYIPLCVYSLKFIDSYTDAEDLVQNLFVRFWEEKKVYELNTSLKSYLFTAVRNNALTLLRNSKKFKIIELNESIIFEPESVNEEEIEIKKQKLFDEIEQLPPQGKAVLNAIIFENKKYKEVADELNISVNTVKTHFSRSLKYLRSSINLLLMIMTTLR